MQTISGADEQSPSVAEERSIARAAAGLCRKVRNDDDVEFETLCLVHGQQSHNFVFLAYDLSFLLAHARVVRAVVEVANNIVEAVVPCLASWRVISMSFPMLATRWRPFFCAIMTTSKFVLRMTS